MSRLFLLFLVLFIGAQAQQNYNDNKKSFIPGTSYYGANKYIEYIHGDLPVILSAPHGGYDKPEEINNRIKSSLRQDKRTLELTLMISDFLFRITGRHPYVIINHLHRIKLDPNRDSTIAVQGDSIAALAFSDFHSFIRNSEIDIYNQWGEGFYIDVHAHRSHSRKIELGYLLGNEVLSLPDTLLNDSIFIENCSLRNLMKRTSYTLAEIVRGEVSFGALLAKKGWEVLPSPQNPRPKIEKYFSGGYNTERHGAPEEYNFNGFQIETHWDSLRDNDENMLKFAQDFSYALLEFLKIHNILDTIKSQ